MFKNLRLENILITDSETTLIDSLSSTIELQSTVLMLADNSFALKSLIKSIGGIYPPNSGRILLDDIDIFSNDRINEDLIKKNKEKRFRLYSFSLIYYLSTHVY